MTFRWAGRRRWRRAWDAVYELIRRERWRDPDRRPLLVLITDGRATGGQDPFGSARRAAARLAGICGVVVDAEDGSFRLGLAGQISAVLGTELVARRAGLASPRRDRRDEAARALTELINSRGAA